MDKFTFILALVALLWTMFQQYQLHKICENCPLFKAFMQDNNITAEELKKSLRD